MSALNLQHDFATIADGLESVTLERRDGGGATPLANALRRAVTTREAEQSDGRYTAADVRWHLDASELTEPPRLGDRLLDTAGETWTVLETRLATGGSRWACLCRNLAIVGGLDTYIAIRRERVTKGAGGAVERTWENFRTGVRARIQIQEAQRREEHGRQAGLVTAKIFVAEQIELDNGYQIVAADGTVFEITGFRSPDTLGRLFEIDAVRRL
jgi:hypothetical protein